MAKTGREVERAGVLGRQRSAEEGRPNANRECSGLIGETAASRGTQWEKCEGSGEQQGPVRMTCKLRHDLMSASFLCSDHLCLSDPMTCLIASRRSLRCRLSS